MRQQNVADATNSTRSTILNDNQTWNEIIRIMTEERINGIIRGVNSVCS